MPGVSEVILFPAAETAVIAELSARLTAAGDTARVVGTTPDKRPDRYVRVIRTGGPASSFFMDNAQMTIEAWDVDEVAAEELAQLCRAFIWAASRAGDLNGIPFHSLQEFGGPARLPDPQTGQYRYTQTVAIELRGSAL